MKVDQKGPNCGAAFSDFVSFSALVFPSLHQIQTTTNMKKPQKVQLFSIFKVVFGDHFKGGLLLKRISSKGSKVILDRPHHKRCHKNKKEAS